MLDISKIRYDGTQSREALNENTLQDYAEQLRNGTEFPPVVVFYDGSDYWLADGFHRLMAHINAGRTQIHETVHQGSKRDAILYSVSANATHGLRRTNADKRHAVMMLLQDAEWSQWSDRAIAELCRVSHNFVGDVRESICNPITDRTSRIVKRSGTTYQQNTANIGKKPQDTGRSAGDVMRDVLGDTSPVSPPASLLDDEAPPPEPEVMPDIDCITDAHEPTELEQAYAMLDEMTAERDAYKAALDEATDGDGEARVSEIIKLQRNLAAVTRSRDALLHENAELKRHNKWLEKKLNKK